MSDLTDQNCDKFFFFGGYTLLIAKDTVKFVHFMADHKPACLLFLGAGNMRKILDPLNKGYMEVKGELRLQIPGKAEPVLVSKVTLKGDLSVWQVAGDRLLLTGKMKCSETYYVT